MISTHLGEQGVELVEKERPDVVILDLGLPDISGYDVLKKIRAFSRVPVIILTVRGEEADVTRGLEWGADDYMTKPFRQMELLSRIKAVIRRADPAQTKAVITSGKLSFNSISRQVIYGQKEIDLTRTEGIILSELIKNAGRIVTHSQLAEVVWGEEYPDATESLRVYIRRLRGKIESDPDKPQIIITKAGVGYLLSAPN
jgi:two-component system KDP operon response regulator KdpE